MPVLYEVFGLLGVPEDVRMQLCVGTSMAIIVPTTIRSYLAHKPRARCIPKWCGPGPCRRSVGVALGSVIAFFAPGAVFKIVFVVFTSFIGTKMMFGADSWRLGDDLPGRMMLGVYGFLTGLFSSLMGVSGGSVSNMVLTLYGKPMQRAVATSAGLGVPITIAGTIGYAWPAGRICQQLPPSLDRLRVVDRLCMMAPVSSFMTALMACGWRTGCRAASWRSPSACSCCWCRRGLSRALI